MQNQSPEGVSNPQSDFLLIDRLRSIAGEVSDQLSPVIETSRQNLHDFKDHLLSLAGTVWNGTNRIATQAYEHASSALNWINSFAPEPTPITTEMMPRIAFAEKVSKVLLNAAIITTLFAIAAGVGKGVNTRLTRF
ncbi:hypothetical protein KC660_04630 [Candidatus Dojkabacteria bacterium]|uniref:Uncharacterized protein n=1 Tax=Candidatus Dojkabacteria bacterium TaxID=2099670 RepID=A0A955RIB6_9BACT|nr:hypothetical protein [Candidatus Dojkabacteria bacterium]